MKIIEFEGSAVICSDKSAYEKPLVPGDIYLAKRNTGWKMLTCKRQDVEANIVIPVENAYPYSPYECFKVISFG